jgi:hypothetical protein
MKSRIELTEMSSSVVAIGFGLGNVLCHVCHNLADINGKSHVNVCLPVLKQRTALTVEPFVIPL